MENSSYPIRCMIPGFPFQPVCGREACWRAAVRSGECRAVSGPTCFLLEVLLEDHDPSITLLSHFDEREEGATLSEVVWGSQSRSRSPSGEAAGRENEFFSPLHRILNSFYLNEKRLQLNLDSHQPVHKTQGKKALMMEKQQMVWWLRAWPSAHLSTTHWLEVSWREVWRARVTGRKRQAQVWKEALISWKKQGLGSRQDVTSEQAPELVDAHLITNETSILRRHCWEADIWPAHSTMHSIWIKYCWLDTNFQIKGHS